MADMHVIEVYNIKWINVCKIFLLSSFDFILFLIAYQHAISYHYPLFIKNKDKIYKSMPLMAFFLSYQSWLKVYVFV